MLASRIWLEKFFDVPLPDTQTLADALTFHAFEIDGIEKKGDDEVLDVKVTPNRGADCLSHRGIAGELSAILSIPLAHDPLVNTPSLEAHAEEVSVSIEHAAACRRYIAGSIKGVRVGPSPRWLADRLEAVGQRSINNVVDATNFVMFNLGQPLHAFDAKKLGSLSIGVRNARAGEKMLALDDKEYALNESMLVITAGDAPVGIAGVKGGKPCGIDETTTDIVIESANFDSISIRKTAQQLRLRTDASARFEQGLSPELAAYGMQSAVTLIQQIAGGELNGYVDAYPLPELARTGVRVSVEKTASVLGMDVSAADIGRVFERLRLPYSEEGGVFEVLPPFERIDLAIEEDFIEEVGRLLGYDRVPAELLPLPQRPAEVNPNFYAAEKKREELMSQGFSEVMTSVFADQGERIILNKVDGVKPYLRATLTDGLADALQKNMPYADLLGLSEIKLFEIGTVWKDGSERRMVATASEKNGTTEEPLASISAPSYDELEISRTTRYQPFSKYPYIVRDVAFWSPAETEASSVSRMVRQEAGALCVAVRLFDRFEKEGRVSLAMRLIFQSFERTLTEKEANDAMEKVYAKLSAEGFEIR